MKDCIRAAEDAYMKFGQSNAVLTPRINLSLDPSHSMKIGAAAIMGGGYMGSFSYSAGFGKKGTNPSTTILYDATTGQLRAFIESLHLKWLRTGATSAIASKYLARNNPKRAGMIGTGRQAKTQLIGLCSVYELSSAIVYSPTADHRERFAAEMSRELGIDVLGADSARDCIEHSDIIVTCSTSKIPVFEAEWLPAGAHVNVIGAHTPTTREVDTETMRRSKVVVESKDQALDENGNLLIPMKEGVFGADKIFADLGEIVSGKVRCRTSDADNTLFLSGGVALDQIAIAQRVYELALASGLGTELPR